MAGNTKPDYRRGITELVKRVPVLGKPYRQRSLLRAVVDQLWEPPGHFYSPIPSIEEIRRDAEKVFSTSCRQLGGIDLNENGQLAILGELQKYYAEQPFTEHKQAGLRYYFENPAFSYCDAVILYCILRYTRPARVIEVGSGYSSCALLDTNEFFFGNSIACTFIEPYPQLLTSLLKDGDDSRITVVAKNLQDVELSVFSELSAGDVLFVDSSHVSKTNSDVNYVFFEILPRLSRGVYVHFHDIFYPFEYPREWVYQGRAWNEAYTLRAFLQYNETFTIQVFNSFLEQFYRDRIAGEMPLCARYAKQSMIQTSAQSIWLKKR